MDEPEKKAPTPGGTALWYAARGCPVFPVEAGKKAPPLTRHGLHDASTEAGQIRAWWKRWPEANVAIATGHIFDAYDIDGAEGQASRAEHWCYDKDCRAAGSQLPPPPDWTPRCEHEGIFNQVERVALAKVITPRPGGMHIWVPPRHGSDGNLAGILPGIDYRGMGGYVIAPPSTREGGEGYRFLIPPTFPERS